MSKSETLEEIFCRLASEVIREQNLASLHKSMDSDLFRFIHFFQEAARAEASPLLSPEHGSSLAHMEYRQQDATGI